MPKEDALFRIGQVVGHSLFGYRGVIIDVDPEFGLTEPWYEMMAKSKPPKDEPWYHVLVDGEGQQTYVAERNLVPDQQGGEIGHPLLDEYFSGFDGEYYTPLRRVT